MARARKFNHEEMTALYETGEWTQAQLAKKYGVNPSAICQVLARRNPEWRARHNEAHKQYQREAREECKGGCGRLVWTKTHPEHSGLCARCLRRQEHGEKMRPDELRCNGCGEWKSDAEFHMHRGHVPVLRRGRKSKCRQCESRTRQAYRERNREADNAYTREYRRRRKAAA